MTDTTDIAALREACGILNDHGYLTKSGKIRSRNLAEAVRMIIEQSVGYAEQLEAERQRADKTEAKYTEVSGWYAKMKTRMLKAEAEIAALKAKLANPVVLPNRRDSGPAIMTYTDAIKAITAAGFMVKVE